MRIRFVFTVLAALPLAALPLAGCRGCSEPPSTTGASEMAFPPEPALSLTRSDLVTTNAEIALGNLDGQINQLHRHVTERPKDIGARATLVGLLRQRSQIRGSSADLAETLEIGEDTLKEAPDRVEAQELHVAALSGVHRFREALKELDALIAAGDASFAANHGGQRGIILQALGRYDEALPLLQHEVDQNPSPTNLDLQGILFGVMGKTAEAEQSFVLAEQKTRDPSPFFLTALYFDRASLWEREGDLTKATDIYRVAYSHLPQHVHVATHLAALLTPKEAVAILEPLGQAIGDPEVSGQLGVFRDMVKDGAGKSALEAARSRYDELMKTMPEAYADHAGWFWLGAGGDPARAFAAAQVNIAARETAEAFELYLTTAAASHHHDEACAMASKARAFPYPSHRLTEQLRQLGDCPPQPAGSESAAPSASASPSAPSSAGPSPSKAVLPKAVAPSAKAPSSATPKNP